MQNKLCFDLRPALEVFVERCPKEEISPILPFLNKKVSRFSHLNSFQQSNDLDRKLILTHLSQFLLKPSITLIVARTFRPILPLLVTQLPSISSTSVVDKFEHLELISSVFGKLLPIIPQILGFVFVHPCNISRFVLEYFRNSQSLFSRIQDVTLNKVSFDYKRTNL